MSNTRFPRLFWIVSNSVAATLFFTAFGAGGFAQRPAAVPPAVFRKIPRARSASPPGLREKLPQPRMHRLGPLSQTELGRSRPGLEAVGVHRRLSAVDIRHDQGASARAMIVAGAWSARADGSRIWRLAIDSEDAVGIRIHFTDFSVGAGRVWVYGADAAEPRSESFTAAGPRADGDFWTQTVFGSEAILEFEPDPAGVAEDAVPFQVKEIAHLWRTPERLLAPFRARAAAATQIRSAREFLENISAVGSTSSSQDASAATPDASIIGGQAAPCQVDVTCYAEWEQTSRAVSLILFESGNSSYACSGTLLNTRKQSFTPYFLTAAHCITSDSDARTVEAFWLFRSSTCNGEAPAVSDLTSTLGARQILRLGDFDDTRGDFNLLLLDEVPDGVTFAGWDPKPIALGSSVVGIHHPAGDQQRITFGTTVPDNYYGVSNNYLIVQEDLGRTEEGSSGSGLFSAADVLGGVLSFGPVVRRGQTVCDIQPSYVGYSSFSALYPSVSDYLEDVSPPPPDPNTPLISGVPRSVSLDAVRRPSLLDDPLLQVVVPENAVSLTIDLEEVTPTTADVDLYVRYGAPPVAANGDVTADYSSLGPAGVEQIVIDGSSSPPLQAGTYYIRLALLTRLTAATGLVRSTIETGPPELSKDTPAINAIVHAADQRESAVAPGQLVSIYGEHLGDTAGVQASLDSSGVIPAALDGVTVRFGGIAAPILYERADQINVQVPYEVAGLGAVAVTITRNGLTSAAFPVSVAASAPEIFTFLDGGNRGIVFNQDGSINSADNPAARGQIIVFYVSGEGVTNPALASGTPAPLTIATPVPALPVSVQVGGAPAEILFAGVAPGLAGVMQVNARIAADAITGSDVFLVIGVGDAESRMVTVSVN
jgi:uncharacterized protein (TIGR03437 family)